MRRLITRGRFTQDYTKGLVIAPEDRREAVRRLVEAAGAHLREFYFTSGDCDFVIISEAADVERTIAALLVATAAGTVRDTCTIQAWTTSEFLPIAEQANTIAAAYRAPGSS